jgi:crotonobetainyl-CoA:carnitine CoA-transferase CaiB-like acyl-CoA transferase
MCINTVFRQVGGMNFAFCIMGALLARERYGVGQKLETSQLGAMVGFQATSALDAWHTHEQRDDGLPCRLNDVVLNYFQVSTAAH